MVEIYDVLEIQKISLELHVNNNLDAFFKLGKIVKIPVYFDSIGQ